MTQTTTKNSECVDGQSPTDICLKMFVGDVLDILSNRRRREAIRVLANLDPDDGIKPERLAERIYAQIHECDIEDVEHEDAKSIYVGLHQRHVDELRDVRLAFEFPDGSISGTERTEQVARLLDLLYECTEGEEFPDDLDSL